MSKGAAIRLLAGLSAIAVIVGSLGIWQTKFLPNEAGIDGDGILTLAFGLVGAVIVLVRLPGSRWLMVAAVIGSLSALLSFVDLLDVTGSRHQLFSPDVPVPGTGWGIWLTAIASVVFFVCAYWLYASPNEAARGSALPG